MEGLVSLDDAYFRALGGFVHFFSSAETSLTHLLGHLSDVSEDEAKALFSGVRTSQGISIINRLLETQGQLSERDRLAPIFNQLAAINTMRNQILHNGTALSANGEKIVFEKSFTRSKDKVHRVSEQMLIDAAFDCNKISCTFILTIFGERLKVLDSYDHILAVSQQPWRYKSSQPIIGRGRNP